MKLICSTIPNNTFVKTYGEVNDVFVNTEKRFAFVKFDYKANADRFRIAEGRSVFILMNYRRRPAAVLPPQG